MLRFEKPNIDRLTSFLGECTGKLMAKHSYFYGAYFFPFDNFKKSYKVRDEMIISTFKNINKISSEDFVRRDGMKSSACKNNF